MKSANLFQIPFENIFEFVKNEFPEYEYDYARHIIKVRNEAGDEIANLRLPLHIVPDQNLKILDDKARILYLSIESGSAAIILKEGQVTIFHKSISAYMSRKKQGFSQIKYLNKKGKSRAGSRVRLAATTEFFENINTLSTELLNSNEVHRIALNCNKTLLPYLYQSKVAPPFEKKDPRLYRIPLHIQKSNTTQLESAIKKLKAPILSYQEEHAEKLQALLQKADEH